MRTVGIRVWRHASIVASLWLFAGGFSPLSAQVLSVLWEDRGQAELEGSAQAVAVHGDIVVAAGHVCRNVFPGSCDWFVRALDAKTGERLWEDKVNAGGFDRSASVAIEGGRVFASGWLSRPPPQGTDFVIRVYDLLSGELAWERRLHGGLNDRAEFVGTRGNRVFVAGGFITSSGSVDFAVFAFGAQTGALEWGSVLDPSGEALLDVAFALATHGDRIFVSGPVNNFSSVLIRAYDIKTGRTLWHDLIDGGTQFIRAKQLASHGGTLFVGAGIAAQAGHRDLFVRAYDEQTGLPRWTHRQDAGGHDEILALGHTGKHLIATGVDSCDQFFTCSLATRAFDPSSGNQVWYNSFRVTPNGDAFPSDLYVVGGLAVAAGAAQNAAGVYMWVIRAYDAVTGATIWDERIADGPGTAVGFANTILALTGSGNRLYAAGGLESARGTDFAVRAYDVR